MHNSGEHEKTYKYSVRKKCGSETKTSGFLLLNRFTTQKRMMANLSNDSKNFFMYGCNDSLMPKSKHPTDRYCFVLF